MSSKHYVNNKKLYVTMKDYIHYMRNAFDKGCKRPRVPEYVGE